MSISADCCIPSSVLLEADGCCIDLNECVSSSAERKSNNQELSRQQLAMELQHTKTRRDLCLAGFFQDLNKNVEVSVVGVHCSLKVAE